MMNPAEILTATIHHGQEKIKRPFLEKAVLGFIGGAMISFGYLLYIRAIASVADELGSLASLIGASVFPIGLIVILLGGGELITSNMTAVSTSFFAKKVTLSELLKNWLIITVFNVLGAIFVAFVFGHLVGLTGIGAYKTELLSLAQSKINASWSQEFLSGIGCNWFVGLAMWMCYGAKDAAGKVLAVWFPVMAFVAIGFGHLVGLTGIGAYKTELLSLAQSKINASWSQEFLSGIGCNWFVGLAMWMCYGAKDAAGKVLAVWFPVMAFVAIGFQHSIANAFVIPAAIFENGASWLDFAHNFLFVYLGNLFGGSIFVAGFYSLGYRRQAREQEELKNKEKSY